MLQHPVCCVSCFCEKQNILLIPPFDPGKFHKWRWCSLSASSMGYLGRDSLGSTLACSRPRESWGMLFAAFCQAARPNPFRHKEGIFRITNVQSVTGQTKWCVSENCCSGKKTGDIKERRFSALHSHVKYILNLSRKKRSKTKLAKPTKYVWPFFPISKTLDLSWGLPHVKRTKKNLFPLVHHSFQGVGKMMFVMYMIPAFHAHRCCQRPAPRRQIHLPTEENLCIANALEHPGTDLWICKNQGSGMAKCILLTSLSHNLSLNFH